MMNQIHVNDNLLTGPVPASFSKLINLESINLSQNRFTGPLPTVTHFANLVLVHLSVNDWDEQILPSAFLQLEQKGVDVWVF